MMWPETKKPAERMEDKVLAKTKEKKNPISSLAHSKYTDWWAMGKQEIGSEVNSQHHA